MIRRLIPTGLSLALALVPYGAAASAATTEPEGLAWGACPGGGGTDGMECARLQVPLDWSKPQGRKVTLMIGRLRADGPGPAEGSVLVNYGGPGAPGIEIMRDRSFTPGEQPFAELRHRMNIVTWDPRGYPGLSKPSLDLSCVSKAPGRGAPDLPRSAAAFRKLTASNKANGDACRTQDPELFDHMDSAANARDMEAIRRALGEPRTNLYMGSYGSVYGQTYARMFPRRVRTMVIDGGADHSDGFARSQLATARDNVQRMRRFARWCAGEASCVLHGQDVPRLWQRLVARAERTPIPAPSVDAEFNGWRLRQLMAGRLVRSGPAEWPALARAVKKADAGDASGFAERPGRPYPSMSYPVSECHEWPTFTGYGQMRATMRRVDRADPNVGAAGTIYGFALACAGWPATLDNPPRPLPAGLPPLLGVGTWQDFPATARVVRRVPGSGTVYHPGTGHELYATGNACVIRHVDRYFTDRVIPSRNTRC